MGFNSGFKGLNPGRVKASSILQNVQAASYLVGTGFIPGSEAFGAWREVDHSLPTSAIDKNE